MKSSPPLSIRFNNTSSSPLGEINLTAVSVPQTMALDHWRTLGQYSLLYIQSGKGTYEDGNGLHRTLSPGDLVFLFPKLAHFYNPLPGTEWVTTWICFRGPLFELWEKTGLLNPQQPIYHLEPIHQWNRKIEAIHSASQPSDYAPPLQNLCRLQQLLTEIITGMGLTSVYQDDLQWISRASSLIESEQGLSPDWKKIAKTLGINSEVFRKRFTRLTGQPPARYRMTRLIDRACVLMQERHMTDFQIAEALGFCDAYYFSRRFKQITGLSPRAFRKKLPI